MGIVYRAAKGSPLTSAEVDANFRFLADKDADGQPAPTLVDVQIDASARTISFELSDGTVLGPFQLPGGGSGGIAHAPSTGSMYASKDGGWAAFAPGIAHGASDGALRASRNGGWTAFEPGVEEAPETGGPFGRQGGDWVALPGVSGTMNHVGDWVSFGNYLRGHVVDHNGMAWMARDDYGTTAPEPKLANEAYWLMVGFPKDSFAEPTSDRLRHRFVDAYTPHRTDTLTLLQIINETENRLKLAEEKLANHETRITALEG